jgi:hypothetical protein
MKTRKTQVRGRGRPASGKHPFTVRMPKAAYGALCRAAKDDGFDHLGDWLSQLPGLVTAIDRIEPARRLGKHLARRRFVTISTNARILIDALYDLVDYDFSIGTDKAVANAAAELDLTYRKLRRFIEGGCR